MSVDGLITLRSSFGPEETMRRLETEVHVRAMTIFGHIDHAEGAAAAGLPLRPTDLLIFGAAKSGTPLMQSAQTIGIDLPLKAWCGRMRPAIPTFPITILRISGIGMASVKLLGLSLALCRRS